MIPAFMACTTSPLSGSKSSTKVSTCTRAAYSTCPTPTVSSSTSSNPKSSIRSSISGRLSESPSAVEREPMERTKSSDIPCSSSIRMRSPKIAPPERGLLGSIARIPNRLPGARCNARWPARVLLPTPGAPVRPMRRASGKAVLLPGLRIRSDALALASLVSACPRAWRSN